MLYFFYIGTHWIDYSTYDVKSRYASKQVDVISRLPTRQPLPGCQTAISQLRATLLKVGLIEVSHTRSTSRSTARSFVVADDLFLFCQISAGKIRDICK